MADLVADGDDRGIKMMRAAVGLLAVAVVLLSGCSSGDNGGGGADGERTGDNSGGPLAGLHGDKLCAMVHRATIEKQFSQQVRDALGGVNPPEQRGSIVCTYVTESLVESDVKDIAGALSIGTKVTPAREEARTAKEALDAYMVGFADDKTVAYQLVEGLGAAAGYAGSELDVLSGGNHLVAILEIDGALIEVVTKSEPQGSLDQLRPIADELVRGVEAALR